jgi:hypothetical protein
MKTLWNLIMKIVSFALMALALITPTGRTEVKPCCAITALDAQAATATAKENGTSRTFVFKVPDARLFATVRVGTPVYANFSTKQVSLDGKSVCCQIIRTLSQRSVVSCLVQVGQRDCWGAPLHSGLVHLAWPSAVLNTLRRRA